MRLPFVLLFALLAISAALPTGKMPRKMRLKSLRLKGGGSISRRHHADTTGKAPGEDTPPQTAQERKEKKEALKKRKEAAMRASIKAFKRKEETSGSVKDWGNVYHVHEFYGGEVRNCGAGKCYCISAFPETGQKTCDHYDKRGFKGYVTFPSYSQNRLAIYSHHRRVLVPINQPNCHTFSYLPLDVDNQMIWWWCADTYSYGKTHCTGNYCEDQFYCNSGFWCQEDCRKAEMTRAECAEQADSWSDDW